MRQPSTIVSVKRLNKEYLIRRNVEYKAIDLKSPKEIKKKYLNSNKINMKKMRTNMKFQEKIWIYIYFFFFYKLNGLSKTVDWMKLKGISKS